MFRPRLFCCTGERIIEPSMGCIICHAHNMIMVGAIENSVGVQKVYMC